MFRPTLSNTCGCLAGAGSQLISPRPSASVRRRICAPIAPQSFDPGTCGGTVGYCGGAVGVLAGTLGYCGVVLGCWGTVYDRGYCTVGSLWRCCGVLTVGVLWSLGTPEQIFYSCTITQAPDPRITRNHSPLFPTRQRKLRYL